MGGDSVNHLLRQIFDEDQRGHEHIGLGDIGAKVCVVVGISKLLDQIAAQVNAQRAVLGIEACCGLR